MRRSVLAIALFLTGELGAQGHPFAPVVRVDGSRIFPASTAVVDVDFDGIKDIVVGNAFSLDRRNGPCTAYVLDASFKVRRTENLPSSHELGLVSHPAIVAGDFSGDRIPDIVSVSDKGAINLHIHQGSTPDYTLRPRYSISSKFRYVRAMDQYGKDFPQFKTYSLFTGDYNEDGNLDVALVGDVWLFFDVLTSSGMTVLLGNGRGGFHGEMVVSSGRYYAMAQGDYNADRRIDLAGLTDKAELVLAFGKSNGAYRTERFLLNGPAKPNRLATADVNSDGRPDFLITGNVGGPKLSIYLADTRGTPGKQIRLAIPAPKDATIEAILTQDFDGDSRTDVVLLVVPSQDDAFLLFMKGDGKSGFGKPAAITVPAKVAQSVAAPFPNMLLPVDLNGDENDEIVIGSCRESKSDKLVQWVLPNRTAQRWGVRQLGAATAGKRGRTPKITCVGGSPEIGNNLFSVLLADAPGKGARAALIMSTRLELRRYAGFTLHVFPFYSFGAFTTGTVHGSGNARVDLEIPNYAGLIGSRFHFQWIVADRKANNPLGLSATRALEVHVGPR